MTERAVETKDALAELLEAWRTNHRINRFLIDHISDAGLGCTLSKHGGRTVARQLAHLHTNRVWQLEKRAPDLAEGLHKFATADEPDREALEHHLSASADAVAVFLERCVTGTGKARPFKKGVATTLAYLIAHDSHHRGNILLTLKQCGHKPEKAVQYAIWDWDRI